MGYNYKGITIFLQEEGEEVKPWKFVTPQPNPDFATDTGILADLIRVSV